MESSPIYENDVISEGYAFVDVDPDTKEETPHDLTGEELEGFIQGPGTLSTQHEIEFDRQDDEGGKGLMIHPALSAGSYRRVVRHIDADGKPTTLVAEDWIVERSA